MKHLKIVLVAFIIFNFQTCKKEIPVEEISEENFVDQEELYEFGYNLNNFTVVRDTIRRGDSFGQILERNNIGYPKIHEIVEKSKDTFDIRKLKAGKPYTLLCTKDELKEPQAFIYEPYNTEYVVIEFCDSILAYREKKPITIQQKVASGVIKESLSITMDEQGLPWELGNEMAGIYAWTIDFFRLQAGDKFKIIYKQRFIEDSIYAGIESIDAAFFEHRDEQFYAFNFMVDSTKGIADYFDENTKSLRRTFLKSPLKFGVLSSRYNLNRRIAYYNYRRVPHKGTDFAAPIGTPILATANGTVTESRRRGGNGKYVKIKHNATYSTQYLHMKAQNVKKGDYVKQGDVIGWIGMTGNTAGPHVCYRFWKNGKQVDPFREKLPAAESIPEHLKARYSEFIIPLREQLDSISYPEVQINEPLELEDNSITQN